MASKHRSSEHPESRAIMYEDTKYSTRKVRRNTAIKSPQATLAFFFQKHDRMAVLNNEFLLYVP